MFFSFFLLFSFCEFDLQSFFISVQCVFFLFSSFLYAEWNVILKYGSFEKSFFFFSLLRIHFIIIFHQKWMPENKSEKTRRQTQQPTNIGDKWKRIFFRFPHFGQWRNQCNNIEQHRIDFSARRGQKCHFSAIKCKPLTKKFSENNNKMLSRCSSGIEPTRIMGEQYKWWTKQPKRRNWKPELVSLCLSNVNRVKHGTMSWLQVKWGKTPKANEFTFWPAPLPIRHTTSSRFRFSVGK